MKTNITGIILAAGKNEICNVPLIKREITRLRRGGVTEFVVVTGHDGDRVERELIHRRVTFVRNHSFKKTQMIDSVKLALGALKEEPDKILILPADVPLVTEETIGDLIASEEKIVVPTYKGKGGHPITIKKEMLSTLAMYNGKEGLRGFLGKMGFDTLEVEDAGILMETNTQTQWEDAVLYESRQLLSRPLQAKVDVSVWRKEEFLNGETVELLLAIDWLGSMNKACKDMNIAYSRGWTMINKAEEQAGCLLIVRQTGGKKGGSSKLTYEGRELVEKYIELKDRVEEAAEEIFRQVFRE